MEEWTTGFSQAELDDAQDRYGLRFPPDLIALLRDRRPSRGYDWANENEHIRRMLAWPFEMLLSDIETGWWWPDWGDRPERPEERREVLRKTFNRVPRLIPIFGHRFLPEEPNVVGNPVFSMYGFDTIYYGSNLEEYFEFEFHGPRKIGERIRRIPFWSDLVERPDLAFALFQKYKTKKSTNIYIKDRNTK